MFKHKRMFETSQRVMFGKYRGAFWVTGAP